MGEWWSADFADSSDFFEKDRRNLRDLRYGSDRADAVLTNRRQSSIFCALQSASVAQLAEQLTLNQLVLGSSPSRGTSFNKGSPGNSVSTLSHENRHALLHPCPRFDTFL